MEEKDLSLRVESLEQESIQLKEKLDKLIYESRYMTEASKTMADLGKKSLKNEKLLKGATILWLTVGILTLIRFVIDVTINKS